MLVTSSRCWSSIWFVGNRFLTFTPGTNISKMSPTWLWSSTSLNRHQHHCSWVCYRLGKGSNMPLSSWKFQHKSRFWKSESRPSKTKVQIGTKALPQKTNIGWLVVYLVMLTNEIINWVEIWRSVHWVLIDLRVTTRLRLIWFRGGFNYQNRLFIIMIGTRYHILCLG